MSVQRKIFHLLADNGKTGRDFRYLPKLNPRHNFNWDDWIIVTDKIDGTTTQADNENIYQRRDKFKKGDPRKFTATEAERYYLEKLEESDPQYKWIFKAYVEYKGLFSLMRTDLMVYFECFGDKINARYKGRQQDIRVFDFARFDVNNGYRYLPFTATEKLCEEYALPIVGNVTRKFKGVEGIIDSLPEAVHEDEDLWDYDLEGWVLRQANQIAKIRKNDLKRVRARSNKVK